MWKCASSIRCWDSNPQPSEHESPPIITMPGLPPSVATILLYDLFFASSSLYCTFLTTREPIFPVTFCPIQSWNWLQKMLLFQERKNSKMKTSYFQKHFANDFFLHSLTLSISISNSFYCQLLLCLSIPNNVYNNAFIFAWSFSQSVTRCKLTMQYILMMAMQVCRQVCSKN